MPNGEHWSDIMDPRRRALRLDPSPGSTNLSELLQAADEACHQNDRAACVTAINFIFDYFDERATPAIAPLGQPSHGRYMQL